MFENREDFCSSAGFVPNGTSVDLLRIELNKLPEATGFTIYN